MSKKKWKNNHQVRWYLHLCTRCYLIQNSAWFTTMVDLANLLLRLPPEIVLRIFSFLTTVEINKLASDLEHTDDGDRYHSLIILAYSLLYLKTLVVDSTETYMPKHVGQERNYIDIYLLSLVVSCSPVSLKQKALISTCPNSLTFFFNRELMDPKVFMEELNTFSDMLTRLVAPQKGIAESTTHQYLNMINGFSLVISSGRDQSSIELPTAVGVLILRLLTHLADPRASLSPTLLLKLVSLDIHNSDLGNFLHIEWGRLLCRFENLQLLKLNNNLIGNLIEEFEWPAKLRILTIANNKITSPDFISRLPKTLEVLSLGRNYFERIGFENSDLQLASFPRLRYLDLERSYLLKKINLHIFHNIGSKGNFSTLALYNCTLTDDCWHDLELAASQENFNILRGTDEFG